jgi:hypothetical protein
MAINLKALRERLTPVSDEEARKIMAAHMTANVHVTRGRGQQPVKSAKSGLEATKTVPLYPPSASGSFQGALQEFLKIQPGRRITSPANYKLM